MRHMESDIAVGTQQRGAAMAGPQVVMKQTDAIMHYS